MFCVCSTPRSKPNVFHDLWKYGAVVDGDIIIEWEWHDLNEIMGSIAHAFEKYKAYQCIFIEEEYDKEPFEVLGCIIIEEEELCRV